MVGRYGCLFVGHVREPCKTAERIDLPFEKGRDSRESSKESWESRPSIAR